MKRRRGFALIASLLLCVILFALGTGLLSKQSAQYEAALRLTRMAGARALAQAGLEDALAKLRRDPEFPPLTSEDQQEFAYTEELSDGGNPLGSYHVRIQRALHLKPWRILRITSQGRVGNARYNLRGELDISPKLRTDYVSTNNPNLMKWIQIEDLGAP